MLIGFSLLSALSVPLKHFCMSSRAVLELRCTLSFLHFSSVQEASPVPEGTKVPSHLHCCLVLGDSEYLGVNKGKASFYNMGIGYGENKQQKKYFQSL